MSAAAQTLSRKAAGVAGSRLAALDHDAASQSTALLASLGAPIALLSPHAVADEIKVGALDAAILDLKLVTPAILRTLAAAVANQPAWSDVPFVLLAERDEGARVSAVSEQLGLCWAIELPADARLIRQAIAAALHGRERQRRRAEAEDRHLRTRQELATLAGALEARVGERIAELREANHKLLSEVGERRAAECKLRENEELHRYTLDLIDQFVWSTEPDGTGVVINPRFYEMTGLPPGGSPRDALHDDDRAEAIAAFETTLALGKPHDHEFRFRMRDGSARYFLARWAPRKDDAGRVLRYYGTFEDIHDRKLAEKASAETQERYRLAARATNDAIWDWDGIEDQLWWSATAARLFGLPSREMTTSLGWWERRIHPDDRERTQTSFAKVISGRGNRWTGNYRFQREDGSYAEVLDRGFLIRDGSGRAVRAVGAMSDLTERLQTQAEIQSMKAELIHVSRLSAMGALASTLAHELNQPLTAVTGYVRGSRRLLASVDLPVIHQVQEALGSAEAGALRAGQIVRRLRQLVARGNVTVKAEAIAKLLEDASELAFVDERLHGVSHRIVTDPAALWVEADRIQIQQVLINLVRNAVQAMADQPRREISILSRALGRELVEISVADTGTGLSDSRKAALFSPFDTSKEEGMGIGLSICRTIVEAHGGKIWAENNEAGGATFRFTLPRADAPGEGEAAGRNLAASS